MTSSTTANPFEAWYAAGQKWLEAMTPAQKAAPFEPWRAFFGAPEPRREEAPNPFAAWQEAMQKALAGWWQQPASGASDSWTKWAEMWTSALGGQAESANPFAVWQEAFQRWATAASELLNLGNVGREPGLFNPFQAFNPFLQANDAWQKLFQTYTEAWSEYWSSQPKSPPSAEVFRNAERRWLVRLEATGVAMAEAMRTEAFSEMLGRSLEQTLVWSLRTDQAMSNSINAWLRAMHLPSRGQVERMFERVVSLEDRLDDIEAMNRRLLRELRSFREERQRAPAAEGSAPEAKTASPAPRRPRARKT